MYGQQDGGAQGRLLKEQLQLIKVQAGDSGKETRYQISPLQRELGFDKGFYVCLRALQLLLQHNRGAIVVGVAGASGSGKTTFTSRLKKVMNNVVVLSMDMYNDGTKVLENNFDDPRIADYDTLLDNLRDLKAGRPTRVPVYDFKQSARVGYDDVAVPESRVIIIEGIYALSQRLAPLLDLKIAIAGGIHFDLVKRVMRDIQRSGQCAGEVIQQISDTVYPMYKAFIEPDLKQAHVKITNNFNPFAGFKEPIQILKTEDAVPVDAAQQALRELFPTREVTLEKEIEVHDIFLLPPGEDPQGCQSWLRMRNKEGRYSLMFAEYVVDDPFIVSPRVCFEVPVRILGGLMTLGYTIGSIMSRMSFRAVCGDVMVKWDRIDKLGCFVQIQGEKRELVMKLCQHLGVKAFIPRSYIEQVQLLQLTEDFTEMTDKARRHFTVGDDVIIDDHVIGASPARKLEYRRGGPTQHVRNSTGTFLRGQAAQPMTQAVGWQEAPVARSLCERSALRRNGSFDHGKGGGAGAAKARSQLSRDMQALSLERTHEPRHDAAPVRDNGGAEGRSGGRRARAQQPGQPPSPKGRQHGSGRGGAGGAGDSAHTEATSHGDAMPWFWEASKHKQGDVMSVLGDLQRELRALAGQVERIGRSVSGGVALAGALAGFAAGITVTMLVLQRNR